MAEVVVDTTEAVAMEVVAARSLVIICSTAPVLFQLRNEQLVTSQKDYDTRMAGFDSILLHRKLKLRRS